MKRFECLNAKRFLNKNLGKSQRYRAFTLAEVLITLGIIGVVAALTIPTLMANYQKVAEVAALKKAYAEVTQALQLMANDMGCQGDLACTGVFSSDNNSDYIKGDRVLGNAFKKYFKLAKDCGADNYDPSDENTKCLTDSYSESFASGGSRADLNEVSGYNFITADGFAIALISFRGDCVQNNNPGATGLNINQVCGEIIIDVNGFKGPNDYGRDIFEFEITNGKGPAIYPYGGSEMPGEHWSGPGFPSCSMDEPWGVTCAGRIMEQGWQMLY